MRRHRHNLKPDQQTRLAAYLAEHPALQLIYRFQQRLSYLLLKKHRARKQCEPLARRFLSAVGPTRRNPALLRSVSGRGLPPLMA